MSGKEKGKLSVFTFHGIHLTEKGIGQVVADCPFCTGEKHLFINSKSGPKEGLWDCKSCQEKGNVYTFLERFHELMLERTEVKDYKLLATQRGGIPWQWFQTQRLARDGNRWLLPNYNIQGKFANLHVWKPGKPVISTPTCALHLVLAQNLNGSQGPIYVCEGHWDTYALSYLLQKIEEPGVVIGAPGAGTFKEEWIDYFTNREVYLLYDSDKAGKEGTNKVIQLLKDNSTKLFTLAWPKEVPDGYDIRDLIIQEKTPAKGWKVLKSLFQEEEGSAEKEVPRHPKPLFSFDTAIRKFRRYLYLDKGMSDALALMFATVLSSRIPGDPLWIFLVGPPGIGKTLLLRCLEDLPDCFFLSSLGAHSLVSGFIPPGGGDPSILPRLQNKCLVLKDYTEVRSLPTMQQEEIYSVLRGAYDGRVRRPFGNRVELVDFDCHFSIIAAVTPTIHGDSRVTLGERFLKCEMSCSQYNRDKHVRAAITGKVSDEAIVFLKQTCFDFLHCELDQNNLPEVPGWAMERIVALAQLVAYLRAGVERIGYDKDLKFRPEPEIGTRLAKQLIKLGQSLALVFGVPRIDARCYTLLEQVAFSTSFGWGLDVMQVLVRNYPNYMDSKYVSKHMPASLSTAERQLQDLLELKAVKRELIYTTQETPGRPPWGWQVIPLFAKLWERAYVGKKPPNSQGEEQCPKRKPPKSKTKT